ncbi:FG-GAP repeat domain-containing protein [Novipirellula artificiosorum]|uniref:FG-GAP repeat protein n=1 Tax=Novipirellula artificiosorum TaxID=2528016 RepID=A0A5C6DB99_9BACT|nr:VCBS repeat-containing protein [Novipirellula artificiosorum]TWU34453.1 FG-GAP repeat protein [Novipirellula artificiosorum]
MDKCLDLTIIGLVSCLMIGCGGSDVKTASRTGAAKRSAVAKAPTDAVAITLFCSDCHPFPNPNRFAKDRWQEQVELGFRIYRDSHRTDLTPPDFDATLAFFRDLAPEEVQIPIPERNLDTRFDALAIPWPISDSLSAVSSVVPIDADDLSAGLLLTDMWTGLVAQFELPPASEQRAELASIEVKQLARLAHPAHIEPADLDRDGVTDFVVADLGTLNPQPERQGSVWWLRDDGSGSLKRLPLRLGLARVAEARPIDYDGDGDQDLLIGDFGLHFVGDISVGINTAIEQGMPRFEWSVTDPRPGTIALPILDFDQDGRVDYLSLVTQQYEMVELHHQLGDGSYQTKLIHTTGDPASGSSSMEVVDFDRDGDLDVLYTNGDTFDDTFAKPFHEVLWLENEGNFPFKPHLIASMPGCYHATTADFDGDGDLDVAAVALLSKQEVGRYAEDTFDGIAWFEQIDGDRFVRHSILLNVCEAATCMALDWNGDGAMDLLVPPCDTQYQPRTELTVYLNQGTSDSETAPIDAEEPR